MKYRRIIALLLCALLLVSAAPAALAEEPAPAQTGEDTTSETPGPSVRTEKPPMVQKKGADTFLTTPLVLGSNDFEITTPGETVYRPFTPTVSATYSFTSVSGYDTFGNLLDGDKNRLIYNDDCLTNEFLIRYELTAGETYYLGVRYYSGDYTGTIPVTIEQHPLHACGDDLFWSYDENTCALTITGSGKMWDFAPNNRPWEAFSGMIESVSLPDGLKSIGNFAFFCESSLFSIDIPEGVETIGQGAFEYSNLTGVTLPESLKKIGDYAFNYCLDLTSVTAREGLEHIGYYAFENTPIESFRIPKTVTYIGVNPFGRCQKLKPEALTVDPANPYYTVDNGVLFRNGDDGSVLLHTYLYTKTDSVYTADADRISEYAFFGNPYLKMLILSDRVQSLDCYAFYSAALESVVIPTSLTYISYAVTEECNAFTDVYYLGSEETRNSTLEIHEYCNDILLNAQWHYGERELFEGTVEWNPEDVQFKGKTPYVIANGSEQTPRFTVRDKDGNAVDPSVYTYEYRENTDAGTGYVIVSFPNDYYGIVQGWFKIYLPATTETTVANVSSGIQIKWKPVENAAGYVIYRRAWSTTTNGWTDFLRWNNTTELTWTDTTVYAGTRYQYGIKAYFEQRVDPVSGATIGGNVGDNYNLGVVGPLKTTVRITTRKLTKLETASGKITASWDASKVFTGYQIKYATNAAFTKNVKSVWIDDPKTSSKTITGLQNNTTYYFCVRSYHNFEGTRYYGEWSNALSAKPGSAGTLTPTTYRALLVGEVNFHWGENYDETANRNGGDVEHMATMLKSVKGPNGNAYSITKKKNLNKNALENAIKNTFAGTTDQDVSLFFIATHGDSSDEGQLVLTDGSNYTQWISFGQLAAMLSKYVKGDVIVVIESCGAGSAIYANGAKAQNFDPELLVAQAVQAFAEAEKTDAANTGELRKSRYYVLAAAKHRQDSWGHEWEPAGNYFTDWLVEGIGDSGAMPADTNNDNAVTLNELYKYISQYDSYPFYYYDSDGNLATATQQVQVYPTNSGYKLFKR